MEHGPLPPHERTWRHPSELAAEEQAVLRAETSPSISRAFALTTGTLGLFAIAVLVLAVTPGDQPQPIAVSATTAPAAIGSGVGSDLAAGEATIASARGVSSAGPARPTTVSALATPIGEGRYALVSQAAIGGAAGSEVDLTLPSGRVTVGEIVERSGDTVLVALSDTEPGHDVAEQRPHDREVVTVMAEPPVTIAYADVSTLEVAEGTAVVDSDGHLVGLCTKSGHGRRVRLIVIDNAMATPDDPTAPASVERDPEVDPDVEEPTTVDTSAVPTTQVSATTVDEPKDTISTMPDETTGDSGADSPDPAAGQMPTDR